MKDTEIEELIRTGRQIEVWLWNEIDYRGRVVAYSQDALQVETGDWYLRGVAEVKAI